MKISVASFNIEKNGQSSEIDKQTKVSDFIHFCCERKVTVIFLCEVHSARLDNYVDFLRSTYTNYNVYKQLGGYSNGYVVLTHKDAQLEYSYGPLKGLNRDGLLLHPQDLSFILELAHFKSGQNPLTKSQLENSVSFLQSIKNTGKWAITGDMNWDYNKFNQLQVPAGAQCSTCWTDQTQAKGGILDWCLAGSGVQVLPWELSSLLKPVLYDMSGPDHKPVIFNIAW